MNNKDNHPNYKKLNASQTRNFSIGFHRVEDRPRNRRKERSYHVDIDNKQVRHFYRVHKRIAVIILIVAAIAFGTYYGYNYWLKVKPPKDDVTLEVTPQSQHVATSPITTIAPENSIHLTIQDNFLPLLEENEDTVGWVKIDTTQVDYPVVQSSDNLYYIDHDFHKEPAREGAIFLDNSCEIDDLFKQRHYVIYGHHMKDGSMFKALLKYKDAEYFHTNYLIEFDTLYGNYQWEVFSAYVTPTTFNYIDTTFLSDAAFLKFIRTCQGKSLHQNSIELKEDDVVLTLSTCCYDFEDARFVVQARLVKDDNKQES